AWNKSPNFSSSRDGVYSWQNLYIIPALIFCPPDHFANPSCSPMLYLGLPLPLGTNSPLVCQKFHHRTAGSFEYRQVIGWILCSSADHQVHGPGLGRVSVLRRLLN